MKKSVHTFIFLILFALLSSGCTNFSPFGIGSADSSADVNANYILSCLKAIQDMEKERFTSEYRKAEERLGNGSDRDRLDFICLSLHTGADDRQFRQGLEVLQGFIDDHRYDSGNMHGLKVLVNRADEAIVAKHKTLQSMQQKLKEQETQIGKLQKQIEEIKNIESIIKSREAEQP